MIEKPILEFSAAKGETLEAFTRRMTVELKSVVKNRKKNIIVFIDEKTRKAYFFNNIEEETK